MFEKRALRRPYGFKGMEGTEGRRKLHNEELSDLYCMPNIMRTIKLTSLRWAEHIAR